MLTNKQEREEVRKRWGRGGGCGGYFHSAEVWFKSTFQRIIYIQVYFRYGMVFCTIESASLYKHIDDIMVVL